MVDRWLNWSRAAMRWKRANVIHLLSSSTDCQPRTLSYGTGRMSSWLKSNYLEAS